MSPLALGYPILKMRIAYEPDIVTARQKTRRVSQLLGFGGQDRARLSTAVSELARNVFQYAGHGSIEFFISDSEPQIFFIRVADKGPGIEDLASILNGTYISESGMGVGLSGSKKLMDHFEIKTSKENGTSIVLGKNFDKRQTPFQKEDLKKIVDQLNVATADSPFEEIQNQNKDLLDALEDARQARHDLTALNSKLQIAYEDAADANRAKSVFLSNMSHEIRTPLGIILGFADLVMDPEANTNDRLKYLGTIKKNAQSLTNLIGDFLDLSKVEAGKIEIEHLEFSLPELMSDLISAMAIQADSKNIKLSLKTEGPFPGLISSDPTRVRQVLINLINNAIKFTPHGKVEVLATAKQETGTQNIKIEVSVRDSGIGIPLINQKKLFEAFMQADSSTTRKYGGTGLGLNLSRHLAEALGGKLFLQSSHENSGSTFCFQFVCTRVAGTEFKTDHSADIEALVIPAPPKFNNELAGMKILLVEDSEDNQFLFERYLKKAGATVEIASDGEEGFEKAKANEYSAILMDVQMPVLDGYGATKKIRDLGITTPIVALTAHALNEDRDRALDSGFNGYLIKPLNTKLLVEVLTSFL